jgi:hypothetical protein
MAASDINSDAAIQARFSGSVSFVDQGKFSEINLTELVTINEAMNDMTHLQDWDNAMAAKFHSLDKKNTGILLPPPTANKVIGGMWLLTQKLNEFGKVVRHKARWVVFGSHQEHMLHYFETYSSVARNESLKMMLSMVVNWKLHVFQFDVETVFLYVKIDALIFVSQVLGFENNDPKKKGWVWRLNKSLYGTKQVPRMWKEHLVDTLSKMGDVDFYKVPFTRCAPCKSVHPVKIHITRGHS